MSFTLHELEILYSECLKLPQTERLEFIADKAKGDKKLEITLVSLVADKQKADVYFYDLQKRIFESLDPDSQE